MSWERIKDAALWTLAVLALLLMLFALLVPEPEPAAFEPDSPAWREHP